MIWGKEIEVLQALTSTPPTIESEEHLQSLVLEITSVVKEAKLTKSKSGKEKRVVKSRDSNKSAESFRTPPQNEPELPAEWELPDNRRRRLWQNYLKPKSNG